MPSPESPAKRMTARSMTSRLVFGSGISVTVDIFPQFLVRAARGCGGKTSRGGNWARPSCFGNCAVRRACRAMQERTAQILSHRIPYRMPRCGRGSCELDVSTEFSVTRNACVASKRQGLFVVRVARHSGMWHGNQKMVKLWHELETV